jgi:hypothetical protein
VFGKSILAETVDIPSSNKKQEAKVNICFLNHHKKMFVKLNSSFNSLLNSLYVSVYMCDGLYNQAETPPAAWEDEDDALLEINLDDTDRLKKLKTKSKKGKGVISGTEFSSLLKERFQTRTFAWATSKQKGTSRCVLVSSVIIRHQSMYFLLIIYLRVIHILVFTCIYILTLASCCNILFPM